MPAPGVFYSQKDLSQIVVGSSGTVLGISGNARWGLADELTPISNLDMFVQMFGKPVSPSETPMFYQLLGWFQYGSLVWVVRPQGSSEFGGVEAAAGMVAAGISAGLTDLPDVPSGTNVVGIYTKYAGVHHEGSIYVNIFDVDDTTGEFGLQVGVVLNDAEDDFDTGNEWFEEHRVSVIEGAKDGKGQSLYIEDVLARDSQLVAGRAVADAAVTDVPLASTSLVALANNSYTAATESEIASGYDEFLPLDAVTIDLLIPGEFGETVQNKVLSTAIGRGDAFAILSPPISETWTLEGISGTAGWISGITAASDKGAVYAMYFETRDQYRDKDVFVPAAGWVAGAYAFNDEQGNKWTAPAGPRRGVLLNVDLAHVWTDAEQGTMYGRKVNYVKKSARYGITVEGQRTLYGGNSALNRVNVARLMLKIRRDLVTFLQDFVYELNTETNRRLIKNGIDAYLRQILSKQGLYDFRTICDSSNNPGSVIDQNKLNVDVYVKPAKVAEFLYLRSIITNTSVDFDAVISQNPA